MDFQNILQDVISIGIIGGFAVIVAAKFTGKTHKEIINKVLGWFKMDEDDE